MNAVTYAIDMVKRQIPDEVLKQTFISLFAHRTRIPVTVSSRLAEEIVYEKVLKDINLIGGTTILVPLDRCELVGQDKLYSIYHVPKELTGNRSIVSIQEVTVSGYYIASGGVSTNLGSEGANAAVQMVASTQSVPYVSEARCSLINENTVMIELPYHMAVNNVMRCVVEYDSTLRNLDPRAYMDFADLVVLATKAEIWLKNQVPMDTGYVKGGAQMGSYKEIIDSYSDAMEQYKTMLKTHWAVVDKLNDYETKKRLLTSLVGRMM